MMRCEKVARLASDYLDGRLPYGRRMGMWFHQRMCVDCGRYIAQLRTLVDLASDLPAPEADAVKVDALVAHFRNRDEKH